MRHVLAWLACLGSATVALAQGAPHGHPTSAPPVRLYVIDCGYLRTAHTEAYGLTPQEAGVTDMAVPCYLIHHGDSWLMFDTGLGDAHADRSDTVLDMTLDVPTRLAPQLAAIGIAPGSIDLVALSHFHFDHVGNLAALPHATLLIQRKEAAKMASAPYPFTPADAAARLAAPNVRLLDGDTDVYGDGSVVLESTPGHSPGHQSLLVRLTHTGTVLLSGDLYHYPAELRLHRIPPREANSATPASRSRMEALVAKEHGAIWIEHDLAHFRTQRFAPAFYD